MAGRPKAKIDWKMVDKYLQAQCTGVGIASLLGIAYVTLARACESEHNVNFEDYSQQKKGEGKELLRATMFKTAMAGDKSLQIWLSKQYLGMSDKTDTTTKTEITITPADVSTLGPADASRELMEAMRGEG